MYPEIDEINKIIEQMSLETDEEIQLKTIFKSLANRQEKLFGNIKEQVMQEMSAPKTDFQKIYTMLVDSEIKNIMNENNFYEVCMDIQPLKSEKIKIENTEIKKGSRYSCGVVFWSKQYELLDELLAKKYSVAIKINEEIMSTKYYFEEFNDFVEKEKEIHKLALQYGVEKPVIYNPMARRALRILVEIPCEVGRGDEVDIDFDFEKHELNDSLILDSYLVWNISEKKFDVLPPAKEGRFEEVVPLWDKKFVVYKFPLKQNSDKYSEYILINNDIRAIKIIDNAVYWQLKQNDYSEMTYKKFTLYEINTEILDNLKEKSTHVYCNYYQIPVLGEIERIRTKADVERCINCFNELKVVCVDSDTQNKFLQNKLVYTYSHRKDYYQIKDDRLKASSICRVCFEKNNNDLLFVDKISYILGYLNHRYPEYHWIGVC